jgi:hypothetical protein
MTGGRGGVSFWLLDDLVRNLHPAPHNGLFIHPAWAGNHGGGSGPRKTATLGRREPTDKRSADSASSSLGSSPGAARDPGGRGGDQAGIAAPRQFLKAQPTRARLPGTPRAGPAGRPPRVPRPPFRAGWDQNPTVLWVGLSLWRPSKAKRNSDIYVTLLKAPNCDLRCRRKDFSSWQGGPGIACQRP